jgi:hypothetical protein
VGIVKAVRGRKASDPWADSWFSTGAPGATRPSAAPVPAAPKPPAPSAATAAPASGAGAAPPPAAPKPPAPAARAAKPSRTGPARKSPTGKAEEPPGERLWVTANDGVCPQSHPVKAKLSSKIFHTPGSRNYSRTQADRCYPDEASAQADGLRPALR